MSTRQTEVWSIVTDAEFEQIAWMVCVLLPAALHVVRITVVPRLNALVASTTNKAHSNSHFVLLSGRLFLLDSFCKILGKTHCCHLSRPDNDSCSNSSVPFSIPISSTCRSSVIMTLLSIRWPSTLGIRKLSNISACQQ